MSRVALLLFFGAVLVYFLRRWRVSSGDETGSASSRADERTRTLRPPLPLPNLPGNGEGTVDPPPLNSADPLDAHFQNILQIALSLIPRGSRAVIFCVTPLASTFHFGRRGGAPTRSAPVQRGSSPSERNSWDGSRGRSGWFPSPTSNSIPESWPMMTAAWPSPNNLDRFSKPEFLA